MRILGRFLLAAATGLAVLMAGVLSAVVLGGFAVFERAAPPGDRLLILEFIAIGVLLGAPMAIAVACWVCFGRAALPSGVVAQSTRPFF